MSSRIIRYAPCLLAIFLAGCGASAVEANKQKVLITEALNKAGMNCEYSKNNVSRQVSCMQSEVLSVSNETIYAEPFREYYADLTLYARKADAGEISEAKYVEFSDSAKNILLSKIRLVDDSLNSNIQARQRFGAALGQGMQNYGNAISRAPKPVTCNTFGTMTTCY